LATSGIGKIGFVDHDNVEISNIHRQIAHNELTVGKNKAQNLADQCKA
jgi:molybdopterin/thiamine biosynthesis adenylyltransferase